MNTRPTMPLWTGDARFLLALAENQEAKISDPRTRAACRRAISALINGLEVHDAERLTRVRGAAREASRKYRTRNGNITRAHSCADCGGPCIWPAKRCMDCYRERTRVEWRCLDCDGPCHRGATRCLPCWKKWRRRAA